MKNMGKIFVLIIAVALAFGALSMYSFAADDGAYTTVYLVPNATWSEDNARFAVYCENGSKDEWVDMYAVAGAPGTYSAEIPAEYEKITFCSMNPDNPANNWNDRNLVWFYSNAMAMPTDDAVLCTIAEGLGSRCNGEWSVYCAIAQIGSRYFGTLQAAIDAATTGIVEIEVLVPEITEDVIIPRSNTLYLTINGNDVKLNGAITVDGKSATYPNGSLTIRDIAFDATTITKDACINFGGTNTTRYITNVTVENCTFTGTNQAKAAIKSYTSGDKNIAVINCNVDNTMHSLVQVTGVNGLTIDKCVVNSKNGINLTSSQNVEITNSEISVSGYAVRAGASSGGASGAITLENNTLKTDNSEGDAVIIIRGAAITQIDLDMTENIIVGDTHIAGTTESTDIKAELNYWSGETGTPVVNGSEFAVYEVYTTEEKNEFKAAKLLGTGTESDPYLVKNVQDLEFFRNSVNAGNTYAGKYIVITADIDLAGAEWTPIGTSSNPFKGVFDGQNYTISNLVVNGGSNSNQGFFGYTTDGAIKNLTIHNAKVSGRLNVAVVAGTPYTTKYTNIKVTGHVEVNGMAYVGGVGGKNAYADWTDITVDVDATSYVNANSVENGNAYRTYVGGVIGFNGEGSHTFKNISSNIKVIGSTQDIGGIFGIAHYNNNFENITFTGSVEAPADAEEVGGIAGVWHNEKNTSVSFTNCVSTGTVTVGETTTTGSIVGGAYNASNVAPDVSGSLKVDGVESWSGIAKIGDTYYATLADAIAAIGSGDVVIELIADATLDYNAREAYGLDDTTSVTINGNGFTLTLNQKNSDWASIGLKNPNAKLILNNMTINKTGYGATSGAWNTHAIIFSCALEMNDIDVNNAMAVQNGAVLNNVNITEANGYYGLWINANGQTVTMNGGSITATNGGRGIKVADQYVGNVATVTLSVKDVTFTTANKAAILVTSPEGATITAENVDISGVAADSQNLAWVDEDYYTHYSGVTVNGKYATLEGGADAYEAYVSIDGKPSYYKTFAEAIKAANGKTVTLLANIELKSTLVITSDIDVTIDLNGFTITYAPSEAKATSVIENRGKLTVKDSVGGGKITTTAVTPDTNWGGEGQIAFPSYANNTIVNKGTFVLESGTIENTSAAGGATYAIDNYAGTITINGGRVYCENNIAIRLFANNTDMGVTVNGGKVEGTRAIWIQLPNSNASIAPAVNVTVTGGTLSGREVTASNGYTYYLAIYSYTYGNDVENVSIDISGGTINGDIALTGYAAGATPTNVEKLNITGGTFNGNIYTYGRDGHAAESITISGGTFTDGSVGKYCADGFKLVANESNNTYGVVVGTATPEIGENGNWWIGGVDTGLSASVIDLSKLQVGANGNWWLGDTDLEIPSEKPIDLKELHVGENGNWWLGDTDLGVPSETPIDLKELHVGENGNWWIGDTDLGIPSETPVDLNELHVGENGNWWLGDTDLGVPSETPIDLKELHVGENGNWWIGDTDLGIPSDKPIDLTKLQIGENGNWWLGDTDLGIASETDKPIDLTTLHVGENGNWWLGDTDLGILAPIDEPADEPTDEPNTEEPKTDAPCTNDATDDTEEENASGMIMIIIIAAAGVCVGIAILVIAKCAKRDFWWYINRKLRDIERCRACKLCCKKLK